MAGYSLGGADILRRAMGKKKVEEMAEQREVFVREQLKKVLMRARQMKFLILLTSFQVMDLTNLTQLLTLIFHIKQLG